jgi:predicted phosphodiesterase
MWLLIGDLHLTDRASDNYRFGIFKWIKKQQAKRDVEATFLLGDLTDSKDRHSATLVNKIVDGLISLQPPVYIDRGNHDYKADQSNPFFDFLNHIEGIKFATDPMIRKGIRGDSDSVALIPHYRTQDEFDDAVKSVIKANPACLLTHQTFDGAIAETGARLTGLVSPLGRLIKPRLGVYAGDVHKPQAQAGVTYVGCPYHVRFGDNYEPRSLFINKTGERQNLYMDAPRKWALTVRGAENLLSNKNLVSGDQVKLTIEMAREEAVEWKKIKQDILQACKSLELEVHGVKLEVRTTQHRVKLIETKDASVEHTFDQFCRNEKVSIQIKQAGANLILNSK